MSVLVCERLLKTTSSSLQQWNHTRTLSKDLQARYQTAQHTAPNAQLYLVLAPAITARRLMPGCANRVALRCLRSVQILCNISQHGENFHSFDKPRVRTAFGIDKFMSCAILFAKWRCPRCPSNDQGHPQSSAMAAGHEFSKMGQMAEDLSTETVVGCCRRLEEGYLQCLLQLWSLPWHDISLDSLLFL